MSTSWNQPPNQNRGNPENTASPANAQSGGYPNQPVPLAGTPGQLVPAQYQNAPGQDPSRNPQGLLSSTVNLMQRWSGKMAAVARYSPQPPAPYLDRYHSTNQSGSQSHPYVPRWKRSRTVRIASQMRQRRERWQNDRPTIARVGMGLAMTLIAVLVIVSGAGAFYGYGYYQSQLPRVQLLAHNTVPQTTRIYDRHGQLLGVVEAAHPSTPVTYADIPQVMQNTMIAAEDASFWTNDGIDLVGITRALVQYVSAGGKIQSGGSTLTQQVIKNLSGDTQDTADRKLQEAAGAIGLTSQYSKAEILTMYFNVAPFSNTTRGIEAAVENYFDLLPKNQDFSQHSFSLALGITQLDINPQTGQHDPLLGLARASMLAAIPQNPTAYDPTLGNAYKQRMLTRQDYVLNEMMKNDIPAPGLGTVTPTIIKQAEDLTANMTFKPQTQTKLAPHFVDWVVGQLSLTLGHGDFNAGATTLQQGGFNIRTTLDANLQKYAEASITRLLTQPDYQWFPYGHKAVLIDDYGVHDSAAVALNTHTGEILAMVGSADYYSTDPQVGGQANAAAGGPGTQEGSSFKPLVYATAFQLGWNPGTILPDNATYVPNGAPAGAPLSDMFHPPDYGKENGNGKMDTTIRYGTDVSWNIPAVKAGAYVGSDLLMVNLQRMGLTHVKDIVASSPLGTSNATVLEMTGAYQTFANGGSHIPPQYVLDIWDNYGRNLFHYDVAHPPIVLVFSPEVAYLETSVLIDQLTRSAEFMNDPDLSFMAQFPDCQYSAECSHQVAAKTGTTDKIVNGVDRVPDNWTIGYTPNIAVGVWSGNADGSPMGNVLGVTGAAPIWQAIISAASGYCSLNPDDVLPCPQDVSPQSLGIDTMAQFPIPSGVQKVGLNTYNGLAGSSNYDYVIKGMEPSTSGLPSDTTKKS
jgi:membrane peptidoglycan carboxypeptidase